MTIGRHGGVRLGGFGVAPAVLPQLSRPRLSREIAPYLAPEAREGGMGETVADVWRAVPSVNNVALTGPDTAASEPPRGPRG